MDFQVRISEAALADLEEILAYSWAHLPETTERFGNAILDHIEVLKRFPYLGSPVGGRPGVRRLVHTPIKIDYRVREQSRLVEILQLRHTSRFERLEIELVDIRLVEDYGLSQNHLVALYLDRSQTARLQRCGTRMQSAAGQ